MDIIREDDLLQGDFNYLMSNSGFFWLEDFQKAYENEFDQFANDLRSYIDSQGSSGLRISNKLVELNMDGKTIYQSNIPQFSNSKENAKLLLGSGYRTLDNKLLVADSINKRAIIIDAIKNEIIWEYKSSRYIVDFQICEKYHHEINIYDSHIDPLILYSGINANIKFINKSSIPISIYSGEIDPNNFSNNLNDYGRRFKSEILSPEEKFEIILFNEGLFKWFSYPLLLNGEIKISNRKLSSQDEYYILESDGLETPFSSRLIKVDSWGNILWSFGEGYLVNPRDVRTVLSDHVLIST